LLLPGARLSGPRQGLTTKSEGAGLGLGLVTGLINASGGEVQFTNRATGGARVSVLFRSARGAKTQSQAAISPQPLG